MFGHGGPLEAASAALRTILPLGLLMAALVPSTVTLHRYVDLVTVDLANLTMKNINLQI